MKNAALLFCLFALPSLLIADELVKVPVGNQRKDVRAILKLDLERRITTLEKAVNQLQNKIKVLESSAVTKDFKVCTLTTPFNGSFSGRSPEEEKARDEALSNCLSATNNNQSICASRNLSCQ